MEGGALRPATDKRWQQAQEHERAYQDGKAQSIRGYEPQVIAGGEHHAAEVRALLEPHLRLTPSTKILEVGSGPDGVCFFLKEGKRFGLDPLADVYRGPYAALQARSGVRLIRGTGEQLPFPVDAFDLVLCENVLDHTRDPQGVLGEIRRVLRPGGALVLRMNISPWPHQAASWAHERLLGRWMVLDMFSPHPFYLGPGTNRRLVLNAGFMIAVNRVDSFSPPRVRTGTIAGRLKGRLAAWMVHSKYQVIVGLGS
jgi:SAM-dependent methyltransferase